MSGDVCHGSGGAGAAVAVLDCTQERADDLVAALEAEGTRAAAVILDASDRASLERGPLEVEERLGPVDILVNAAGINSSMPFFEIELEERHRILGTNLTSLFLACQVLGRRWRTAAWAERSSTLRRSPLRSRCHAF